MPLSGTFTSSQTVDGLKFKIPLKGVSPTSVDILATPRYIKINYAPYLLHIDLYGDVDESTGIARVDQGVLYLSVGKKTLGVWPEIIYCCKEVKDAKRIKNELNERRLQSVLEFENREKERKKAFEDRRESDKKASTRQQMAIDEAERNELDDKKEKEKLLAEKQVYERFRKMKSDEKNNDRKEHTGNVTSAKSIAKDHSVEPTALPDKLNSIFMEEDAVDPAKVPQEEESEEEIRYVPAPRSASRFLVDFTTRVFPTPMRESTREEEEDWLLRNGKHVKGSQRVRLKGHDISERDPYWLKDKGDGFFKKGDFMAAINAYTTALEADPEMLPCLSNRAACYLKLKKFKDCSNDCTTALNVLESNESIRVETAAKTGVAPPKELRRDRNVRKKVLIRRGTALCAEGNYVDGLKDYQLAQELFPMDENVSADCARIALLVQCDALRETGNDSFKSGDYGDALQSYSKALDIDPGYIACYANRAACNMAMQHYDAAANDISKALKILDGHDGEPVASGKLPNPGTDEFKIFKKKLLIKRGLARTKNRDFKSAAGDYEAAVALDPMNKDLVRDWRRLTLMENKN